MASGGTPGGEERKKLSPDTYAAALRGGLRERLGGGYDGGLATRGATRHRGLHPGAGNDLILWCCWQESNLRPHDYESASSAFAAETRLAQRRGLSLFP
jgi:hypothetical protein